MRRHLVLSCWVGVCLWSGLLTAGERAKVLLAPRFDPEAARIELFAGIEAGAISAVMRPQDEQRGAIFVENLTTQPLTVELPDVLIGVQVLPQFNIQVPAGTSSIVGNNGTATNQGQGQGQNQPVGGTATGARGSSSGQQANFDGFFSIPPETIARVEYASVCLEHGAKEPQRGNTYRLVRVDEFSKDPRMAGVLRRVGRGEESQAALQAAAWHVANDMPWNELEGKRRPHLNAPDEAWFRRSDLDRARAVVADIETRLAGGEATKLTAATDRSSEAAPRATNASRR